MRIAAAQIDVQFADIEANVEEVVRWIGRAKTERVDLVVFPECALTGYCFNSREEATTCWRSLGDPLWNRIASACDGERPLFAVVGFLERDDQDRLFNASAIVGPAGVIGSYRKIHLPQLGVDRFVDRGDRPYAVHRVGEANVGLAICYDCSFPEPMRVLGLERADIIALATNWPVAAARTARVVPSARSMENHLFFVAANRVGRERSFQFCGLSSICGPDGIVLAECDHDQPTLLTADVDLQVARNKRIERTAGAHVIDRFADRQPEFYQKIIEPT